MSIILRMGKRGLIQKTLQRCRSMAGARKAEERARPRGGRLAVYVGPEKERFLIRTECVNHPLFRALLEEAEAELGYPNAGPIELPCKVEAFREVMREVEGEAAAEVSWCNLGRPHAGYRPLNPVE